MSKDLLTQIYFLTIIRFLSFYLNYNYTKDGKKPFAAGKGNRYKMVAAALSISINTVRTYIKRTYKKLQVHSQVEAINKINGEKLL